MRKLTVLFLALILVLGLKATAWGAYATLAVDNTSWTFSFTLDSYGEYELSQSIQESQGYWSIGISAYYSQADPYISYAINAQNNTATPKNFSFTITAELTLPAGPTEVSASIVGGLTDSTGNGVSITPTAAKLQVATVGNPSTSLGVDVGESFSHGSGRKGALYAYGPYDVGPQAGPYSPGDWSFMQVTTAFTLSGNKDATALTGFVELNPVPAPATLLLFLSGLLGLFYLGRRRA